MPEWTARYLGLPFRLGGRTRDGIDCWGLVMLVYREVYGVHLLDYAAALGTSLTGTAVLDLFEHGVKDWTRVALVQTGDVVAMRVAAWPLHVGIALDSERMIHAWRGGGVVIERYTSPLWVRRKVGTYRYVI